MQASFRSFWVSVDRDGSENQEDIRCYAKIQSLHSFKSLFALKVPRNVHTSIAKETNVWFTHRKHYEVANILLESIHQTDCLMPLSFGVTRIPSLPETSSQLGEGALPNVELIHRQENGLAHWTTLELLLHSGEFLRPGDRGVQIID